MEWHIGQDDTILEQERGLQHESPLIVQDVVPPASRENLWNYNGDPGIRLFVQKIFDIIEDGTQDRTVWAGEHRQLDTTAPLGPLDLYACSSLGIHIHHHCPNLARTTACVIDGSYDRLIDTIDGHDDDIAPWKGRAMITRERHLF